ncbi:MAG: hypothetical protein IJR85_02935 [Synergistaceae bacterium]|nr:hypothetical protein [Synergistaceae bacterium]
MKKFVACALLLGLLAALSSPVFAWDSAKQKNLGQDKNKMQWYLLDYGKDSAGIPYAISRKYYTNTTIKNETIELLMSKFGLSPEVAGSLYFTEYGYEYTPDGKQFAMTYLRHYDMLGNLLHGTEYEGDDKTFSSVAAVGSAHAVYKGAALAVGKAPAATTTAKKATASTAKKSATVPAKRVVRAKKK